MSGETFKSISKSLPQQKDNLNLQLWMMVNLLHLYFHSDFLN